MMHIISALEPTISLGSAQIHIHGLVIAGAILLAILCAWLLRSAQKADNSAFFQTVLSAVVLGTIGARLLYVCFYLEPFRNDGSLIFRLSSGGYSLLGGMLGAFAATAVCAKVFGFSLPEMLDAAAPAGMLGIAVGRLADYFTGEDIGIAVAGGESGDFPAAVAGANGGYNLAVMVFASIVCAVLFFVLIALFLRTYRSGNELCRKGDVFLGFMLLFGIAQTVLESLRIDALYFNLLGFVKVMQIAAIVMAAAVIVIVSIRSVKAAGRPCWWHYAYWGIMACCLGFAFWGELRMSVGTMTRNYTVMISGLLITLICTVIMYFHATDKKVCKVR